ncbi:hypothetical protein N7481_009264 [Penicillium waksmanii]|uniref:uncharacterized protein n=1 Tax=Penicillium waksmanii TaxID=69791 RepID=UPI00254871D1|nr:uncharacterized protein N7481_009264 [Penicillium waksmanii]KAJ5975557.1 hypothetical protein N7481_009264 [Penicillium waksmanii]
MFKLPRWKEGDNEDIINESFSSDRDGICIPKTVVAEEQPADHRVDETWLTSTLQREGVIPASLKNAGPIILHALHLLSRYPFLPPDDKSQGLLEDDFCQGQDLLASAAMELDVGIYTGTVPSSHISELRDRSEWNEAAI